MFDLTAKREMNHGYSDGLARGMEIVLTPLLMGGLGWLLDGWLGTGRVLAVTFGILGVSGIFTKLKIGYDRDMVTAEAGKPWNRRTSESPPTEGSA